MTKYTIGEIFSSGRATLYKNSSDQTVKKNERFHNLLDLGCVDIYILNIYTENIVLGFFELFISFDSIAQNVKINWRSGMFAIFDFD